MEIPNDNTQRLLEMLENPQAYNEQEIGEIISHDEATYHLLTEIRQSFRQQDPADIDAAWKSFCKKRDERRAARQPHHRQFRKMVAAFISLICISGITFAAIQIVHRQSTKSAAIQPADVVEAKPVESQPDTLTLSPKEGTDNDSRTFDNIAFEIMLTEIASHYGADVVFENETVKPLRFYFVWYPGQPMEKVVETLNHFDSINIVIDNNKLIVK